MTPPSRRRPLRRSWPSILLDGTDQPHLAPARERQSAWATVGAPRRPSRACDSGDPSAKLAEARRGSDLQELTEARRDTQLLQSSSGLAAVGIWLGARCRRCGGAALRSPEAGEVYGGEDSDTREAGAVVAPTAASLGQGLATATIAPAVGSCTP
jgi:hypothetical protein